MIPATNVLPDEHAVRLLRMGAHAARTQGRQDLALVYDALAWQDLVVYDEDVSRLVLGLIDQTLSEPGDRVPLFVFC